MTDKFYTQLKGEALKMGVALGDEQLQQLFRYYELLVEKNKVMNLTAITEESEVITKHFVDSLGLVKTEQYVPRETYKDLKLIDVGTGAGFPGLVLKIAFPELQVTLSDSLMKRLKFLDEVIAELKLEGVETVHGRAEDLGHDRRFRAQYDLATARAVANLSVLAEYDLPFVKPGGYFIPYKAGAVADEVQEAKPAISVLGGKLLEQIDYKLPDTDISRSIIVIRKAKETPNKYPRKAGTPAKEPLH